MTLEDSSGDSLFNQFAEVKPVRTDVSVVGTQEPRTLSGSMRNSPKMTEFQVLDSRLFPKLREDAEWLDNLMMGRVFPDTLNPLRNIIMKHLLQEDEDISFAEAVVIAEVAVTVPLDGMGRLDEIHSYIKGGDKEEEGKKQL